MNSFTTPSEKHLVESETRDALQSLVNTLVDAGKGFEVLKSRAEGPMLDWANHFADMHAIHLGEIHDITRSHGMNVEMSGTVFGNVQEAVMVLRDTFSGLDGAALDALHDGEQSILARYDSTMEKLESMESFAGSRAAFGKLLDQRAALETSLSRLSTAIEDAA